MIYKRIAPLQYNPLSDVDSYKVSFLYPDAQGAFAYLEARGGEIDSCTLASAQYLLHMYIAEPIQQWHIDEMTDDMAEHGEPFDPAMWDHIRMRYNNMLPLKIRAIPEGTVVPLRTPVLTVECVDPVCVRLVSWFETKIDRLWYASTVAIRSREARKIRWKHLKASSDNPLNGLAFGINDFGARGVSALETARLGGCANLMSGFLGTDNIEGIRLAKHYYDSGICGYSIPATEHSMLTYKGREGELDTLEMWVRTQLIERQLPPGVPKMAACVADSYNVFKFVEAVCTPRFLNLLRNCGGTLVIRPDSGDPHEILPKIFNILEQKLPAGEITVNSLGFKVLPSYLRLIQGDGINIKTFDTVQERIIAHGWSIDNIVFGSGGGLLQQVSRDTQSWAYKFCAVLMGDKWVGCSKDPVTDPGKRSKEGRIDTIRLSSGEISAVVLRDDQISHPDSIMNTIFENGDITYHTTFAECRARMDFEKV